MEKRKGTVGTWNNGGQSTLTALFHYIGFRWDFRRDEDRIVSNECVTLTRAIAMERGKGVTIWMNWRDCKWEDEDSMCGQTCQEVLLRIRSWRVMWDTGKVLWKLYLYLDGMVLILWSGRNRQNQRWRKEKKGNYES